MLVTLSYIKIKSNNRASNELYNLCEFFKFPINDSFLLIHFSKYFEVKCYKSPIFYNLFLKRVELY